MIDLAHRNIFVYDNSGGQYVAAEVLKFLHLGGHNFAVVCNDDKSIMSSFLHFGRYKFELNPSIESRSFENVVKDNLFRLDYLILDVNSIDSYFDRVRFIKTPIIFLSESNDGISSFHSSRILEEYNIYLMYKKKSQVSMSSTTHPTLFIPRSDKSNYTIKDIKSDKEYSFDVLKKRYVRDKKIDDILGSSDQ